MREIRQLVERFVQNDINYGDFRREVVSRFFALADQDAIVQRLYDLIDGACSAFDNHYIDMPRLREMLNELPRPVVQTLQTGNAAVSMVTISVPARVVRIAATFNGLSSRDYSGIANRQVAVEDESLAHA